MKTKRWSYPRYKIPCGCGCGELIDNRDRWGTEHHFKNGHFTKGRKLIPEDRKCSKCESYKTYKWRKHDGLWYCNKCNSKYFENPIAHPIHGPKRINFRGRRVQLKRCPRTGECQDCHRKVGQQYTNCFGERKILKRTALHHIKYHPEDPLKDTIELCLRCHWSRHRSQPIAETR